MVEGAATVVAATAVAGDLDAGTGAGVVAAAAVVAAAVAVVAALAFRVGISKTSRICPLTISPGCVRM